LKLKYHEPLSNFAFILNIRPYITAELIHTGNTGLAISSTSGYVDVEEVRFTGAHIGTSNVSDVITMSDAGIYVNGTVGTDE